MFVLRREHAKWKNVMSFPAGVLQVQRCRSFSTCGTFYYETAKFLASYLLPLTENEYSIKTTTDFAEHLSNRTVDDDEVLVSYDVSPLFTEVPPD